MEERKGRRIIMFPLPFPGHFNPMIHLAGIFHHRGFSVTILHTSYNFPDSSLHPNFTFRTISHNNEGEEEEDLLSHSETSGMDLISLIRLVKQKYAGPFRESLAAEVGGGETVCCLVSDAIWGKNSEDAAKEVGVRRVVLRTGGAASFCAFAAFPLLRVHQNTRLKNNVISLVGRGLTAGDLSIVTAIKTDASNLSFIVLCRRVLFSSLFFSNLPPMLKIYNRRWSKSCCHQSSVVKTIEVTEFISVAPMLATPCSLALNVGVRHY